MMEGEKNGLGDGRMGGGEGRVVQGVAERNHVTES